MKRTIFCVSAFLFLIGLGLGIPSVRRCFACNTSGNVVAINLQPGTAVADAQGKFSATLRLGWGFKETPFLGAVEIAPGNVNLGSATYTPSYFFPASCLGGIDIVASGRLTNPRINGMLNTKGWMWNSGSPSPYDEHTHNLIVLHR